MSLFSIAPSTPFLPCLASAVMDGRLLGGWDRTGPFWLSDVTIILPTQRAREALVAAFSAYPDFTGLLPDIRTFGGEVPDEEPFLPPFDAPNMPERASSVERRLVLSQLVAQWARSGRGSLAFSTPPTAAEIFSMADSLGRLIDDLWIEERSPADIRAIGADMEQDLGEYWQQTLDFLGIALELWPNILGDKRADPARLRRERLDRQAIAAPYLYGERPVIAAGSTGSIPATARLLHAIAKLPRGAVVLPGLDMAMSPQTHEALLNLEKNPQGHPQYGFAQLLRRFGAGVGEVVELCPTEHKRTAIINHALALTDDTALWSQQRPSQADMDEALAGVSIIRARHEDEEARAIALAARSALETGKTVGIVTPDRNLARRIAAELKRFSIHVDDAAGAPLFQSPAGRLARQVLQLVSSQCSALDLVALLRNPSAAFGDRTLTGKLADAIDLGLLRGQRLAPGMKGLRSMLAEHRAGDTTRRWARRLRPEDLDAIETLFDALEAALAPMLTLLANKEIDAAHLAKAIWESVEAVSAGANLRGREELADWANQLAAHIGEGHRFPPFALDGVLATLMSGFEVRNREERRTDIAIWGQLEARLMSPDVMILGALNEDKWPAPADPGPWLSRGMRIKAGLEPPERQHGLAAHDFAQAIGNEKVIIAYAERVGSSPALPSRLLQRLDAFIGEDQAAALRQRGQIWLEEARAIDAVTSVAGAPRPAPNPPVHLRPRKLSVTEIETLMRSPYDLYARHVLKLRPLDPLGDDPDTRERGTIIHAIFARFVTDKIDPFAPDALDRVMAIAAEEFSGLEAIGERRDIWLRRFRTTAEQFLEFERARDERVAERHAEIHGRWEMEMGEPFAITGQADRVDLLKDGTLEILDFKTGSVPAVGVMKAFEAPQLPLEALMADAGALTGVPAARTSRLTYIKVALGPDAFTTTDFVTPDGMALMDAADEVGRRMQGHIEHFLLRETPMPSRLYPLKSQSFAGAYDHLSRLAEWTVLDGEDEE